MGVRQDSRARMEAQIVEVGRRHLITDGAAGLSLRGIARDLGVVSSAVYRYVSSRDDLLTLLLVDAYSELADVVDRAAAADDTGWRERIVRMAHAAREWAVSQPARWALLYGSPVPGYRAPAERTTGPGTRMVGSFFRAVAAGIAAGDLSDDEGVVPEGLSTDFGQLREQFGFAAGDAAVAKTITLWAGLIGAISLEVFGQYGSDTFSDPRAVFDLHAGALVDLLTVNPADARN
ncbi:TetR/AcrR family transcriptional regulator [Mycolicibacterium litorale]|nr:TetR/AcrR family transcriptional regulator [Mycolicibacterium litorale]MCV7418882.1 TetR/AcrR family transcriptional regulator [Mycolicibacterium litorale]TDY00332.1 TetR family transcriptional regulator [Mycolicibacterium litorale]